MGSEPRIFVREILPGEKNEVERLFSRSLGFVDRIIFSLSFEEAEKSAKKQTGGTLVAVHEDRIVGSVSVKTHLINGKKTGFIDALVVDRELRGVGIGRHLVETAITWLEDRGCEVIYATADRYNSGSWNLFIHRGFTVYEIPYQIKDYGLDFLRLWLVEFYFIGYGTFFLRRSGEPEKVRELGEEWHFLAAWAGLSLIWWMLTRRSYELTWVLLLTAVTGISLLAHELPQRLVWRRVGLEATFKAWGSGILFALLLSSVNSFFPVYGSTYVKQTDYRYKRGREGTGIAFAVGPLVSLALATVFWFLASYVYTDSLAILCRSGFILNLANAVFNAIPVQGAGGFVWDGRKIFEWDKAVWLIIVAGSIALIVIDTLY